MKRRRIELLQFCMGAQLLALACGSLVAAAPLPGGTLDPLTIPKYVTPLVIPPVMPHTAGPTSDQYDIAVRQFQQQILPPTNTVGAPLGPTTVWSYGTPSVPGSFNYPAFTIEATYNRPVQVNWINDLKDPVTGACLPHLFPVDQTLHWANPPGPRDMKGTNPAPYTGPVPLVTHVHGIETNQESDGYPEAWYLPNCTIPPGINFTEGSLYNLFKGSSAVGNLWTPGSAVFTYPNTQRATTLWYHDHALGMTRLNVYAGPAGFYLLRGGADDLAPGVLPGPAPALGDPPGAKYYEIPIVIQDRSFNADGSLFYPGDRAFFEGVAPADLQIPFIPTNALNGLPSDIAPIWNPEFFGNTMVVNGKTWPFLEVEKRRYRLRILNGSQSRFLLLKFDNSMPIWQIGAEGGFLPAPVQQSQLLISPAERADVIVDFTNATTGAVITMLNLAPDAPFGGGVPFVGCLTNPLAPPGCYEPADATTTGQVMQFRVIARSGNDTSTPPNQLALPARAPLPGATKTRYISLNEMMSMTVCVAGDPLTGIFNVPIVEVACTAPNAVPFGPAEAMLGTVNPVSQIPTPLEWRSPLTETPSQGTTEIWEVWNFTGDAHPIHIHQVQFEVLGRQPMAGGVSLAGSNLPLPAETGTKDTVTVYPGEIARVKATFQMPGLTVWHCHILEHEDNEMMRPYCTLNPDGTLPASCQFANRAPEKPGIYSSGYWYLDVNGNGAWNGTPLDRNDLFGVGLAGAVPVRGDWTGTGKVNIGVFDNGTWYLDQNGNSMWDGTPTDGMFTFGAGVTGAIPVTGDWSGSGKTRIGIYSNGTWYLDLNGNGAWDGTPTDGMFTFGAGVPGAIPVTGDWTGNGKTRIGIYADGTWYLDLNGNGAWDGTPTDGLFTFGAGLVGAVPVTGDWMGTGTTNIGVFLNGDWYLDLTGNGAWDGLPADGFFSFGTGLAGVTPIAGKW